MTNNLAEITEDFVVHGFTNNGNWEEFEIGENYEASLITKNSKLTYQDSKTIK